MTPLYSGFSRPMPGRRAAPSVSLMPLPAPLPLVPLMQMTSILMMITAARRQARVLADVRPRFAATGLAVWAALGPAGVTAAQPPAAAKPGATVVRAQARPNPTPAWGKGIQPLTPESYYNAIECGKQDGGDPPCVFWDTGVCKNDDFTLTWYTPYKQVAYEVWFAVRKKQPAPQPNYQAALKQRVTIGVTPVKGAANLLKEVVLTRGGKPMVPMDRSVAAGSGRYTFDTPLFAATADIRLDLVGSERTISCAIPTAVLRQFR